MSRMTRSLAFAVAASVPLALQAQQPSVPTTPRECVEELRAYRMAEIFAIGYFDAPYIDKSAIEKKVVVRAKDCESRFPLADVKGKQLDALGQIYVMGNDDQQAKDIYARRLGESGITVREKGLALEAAVEAFSDHNNAERVPVAEKYMKDLDALPAAESGKEASQAHSILANTYRLLGKDGDQIAHGVQSLSIAQNLTQFERDQLKMRLVMTYGDLAEAYVTMGDAKEKIGAIENLVLKPKYPDVPDVKEAFEKAVQRGKMLGRVAPNLYSNHWFNAKDVSLPNDSMMMKGTVPHVVEFTQFG